MKRVTAIKYLMLLLIFLGFGWCDPLAIFAGELDAQDVIDKMENRYEGETDMVELTMVLIDRRGSKRIRKIKSFRKDYGNDSKFVSFFIRPADVKGTTFLTYEWDAENKEDDSWLYLPALKQVKRIASNNKKDSFMGTDFSFSDINGMESADWDYRFVKETEEVDGHECWVIAATPKKSKIEKVLNETGYVKYIGWIRKDIHMLVKAKYYVKKQNKIKYFIASNIEEIQGIWTAKKLQMITTRNRLKEHVTVLLFENFNYNTDLPDSLFTTQRMEQGL